MYLDCHVSWVSIAGLIHVCLLGIEFNDTLGPVTALKVGIHALQYIEFIELIEFNIDSIKTE